ncbi:MAG: T9SS type A sorting domain-containing protein, partial [Bacteroidia bacterium]|nr:T9SS type A sorting domain-containing protein [Bacteroidia bacterium]
SPMIDGTPVSGTISMVHRAGLSNYGSFVTGLGTCSGCRFAEPSNKPTGDLSFAVTTYPNPTTGNVFLDLTTEVEENVTISVTNLLGQVVKTQELTTEIGINQISLDLSSVPAGIYTVTVQTANQRVITKVEKIN